MSEREERAQQRRETWTAQVVSLGDPKGPLYADLTVAERLAALVELNRRAWAATGQATAPPLSRAEWPGEVLDLRDR